jgi:uncharacterized hydrophobic protein (TIGR00271 family)
MLKLKQLFRLIPEECFEDTYLEVIEGAKIKGYIFWILGFAMIIACVGLNTDSVSAIIGAMLISPLMGPIVGFAFGLGINDTILKQASIINWGLMSLISLVASTLFFVISPFNFDTAQLEAFTQATIFDILIAFFGGMAGFIGLVKSDGTKVIAGVAVATACMPPLCTAGYGLAHLDYGYFFGGLYFYLINCLFIGLATFILTRFNQRNFQYSAKKRNSKLSQSLWISLIVAMLIPSLFLAFKKYKDELKKTTSLSTEQRIKILEERIKLLEQRK